MTADQFRALENLSGSGHSAHHKTDELLAAAVAGFTSLTRPGRYDSQQFEDLALPLLDTASPRARRQVSAILAQHDFAPRTLVLKLANDNIEIAAPLLLRSPVLTTADLAAICGEHGLSHARIIARRHPVDPMLLPVLDSFEDVLINQSVNTEPVLPPVAAEQDSAPEVQKMHYTSSRPVRKPTVSPQTAQVEKPVIKAHDLEDLPLAQMLRPGLAEYLIDMALLIDGNLFRTALADALDVTYNRANTIIGSWPNSQLPLALKAIGLSAQDTYMILTAVLGTIHGEREQLREFVHIYRSISQEQAASAVKRWKTDDMNDKLRDKLRDLAHSAPEGFTKPANSDSGIAHKQAQ